MPKDTINDFLNNPFSIHLMKDIGTSTKELHKRNGFKWNANNHHLLSKSEKYLTKLFETQSRLISTASQIQMIRVFISRYPLNSYYLKNGISQLDYIQYHIETLAHKIHTVLEIMKLLLNYVYDFNIPDKDCSWINLCKKINKKSQPMLFLDVYFKTFENLIDARHLNSHRGIYNDSGQEKLEKDYGHSFYKFEATHGFEVDEEIRRIFPKVYLEMEIKQYRKDRIKLIDDILMHNASILKEFLNSLKPRYDQNLALRTK